MFHNDRTVNYEGAELSLEELHGNQIKHFSLLFITFLAGNKIYYVTELTTY